MPVYSLPDNEWTHRGDTWPYMSTVISAAERGRFAVYFRPIPFAPAFSANSLFRCQSLSFGQDPKAPWV